MREPEPDIFAIKNSRSAITENIIHYFTRDGNIKKYNEPPRKLSGILSSLSFSFSLLKFSSLYAISGERPAAKAVRGTFLRFLFLFRY